MVLAASVLTACSCCGLAKSESRAGADQQSQGGSPELSAIPLAEGALLDVVATTNIVGDVVENVGGQYLKLKVLMPRGTDPHAFEPTPQDAVAVADADVVFANGASLEVFLEPLLQSVGEDVPVVELSSAVELLRLSEAGPSANEELHTASHDQDTEYDPHTWLDPNNVMVWTTSVERTLSTLDPAHKAVYESSAASYLEQLGALDAWIRDQIADVPADNRRLVTDHASLGYFAQQYGVEEVGSVFPGHSTLAEPSAGDLAALERAVEQLGVRAVFVGMAVNPSLAARVSEDAGVRLVRLYVGSLSEVGGPADTYLRLMRYDVTAIVRGLGS